MSPFSNFVEILRRRPSSRRITKRAASCDGLRARSSKAEYVSEPAPHPGRKQDVRFVIRLLDARRRRISTKLEKRAHDFTLG